MNSVKQITVLCRTMRQHFEILRELHFPNLLSEFYFVYTVRSAHIHTSIVQLCAKKNWYYKVNKLTIWTSVRLICLHSLEDYMREPRIWVETEAKKTSQNYERRKKNLINIRYSNVFTATNVFHENKHREAMKRENENIIVYADEKSVLLFYYADVFERTSIRRTMN